MSDFLENSYERKTYVVRCRGREVREKAPNRIKSTNFTN